MRTPRKPLPEQQTLTLLGSPPIYFLLYSEFFLRGAFGASWASGLVSAGVLGEPLLEVGLLAARVVVDTGLVVLGVELERGVASDLETGDLVDGGIELGDDEVVNVGDVLGQGLPSWGEGLAVAAPWGVVLDEHILGGVTNDGLPGLADNDGEAVSGGVLWDIFRLKVRGQLAVLEVLDELGDIGTSEVLRITVPGVLEHLLLWADQTESGHVALVDADELTET